MDILNAKQAFEAMSSGQAVLCRAVGQLLDFGELSQFPATVFFGSDYEFCLAPRFMTIGQVDLEVPECIQDFDDLIDAAMYYYAPNLLDVDRPIEILSTAENANYLKRLITSKLLHKTADNAIAHARAFITLNGGSLDPIEVETTEEKPVKKRTRKTKEPVTTDASIASVEVKPESRPAFTVDDVAGIETDSAAIIEKFTAQIANCTTTDAVLSLRPIFFANGHLEREQQQYLCKLTEDKLLELDPEQYAPKQAKNDHQLYLDALKTCSSAEEIEVTLRGIESTGFSEEQLVEIEQAKQAKLTEFQEKVIAQANEYQYQKLLSELVERASVAQSPTEANALYKYTMQWSEEQRKPLMSAITKRLNELNAVAQPIETSPSLMVQIQNAPDLTALDVLEVDVGGRHPDIQSKLMGFIKRRRFELENGPNGAAQ